MGTEYRALPAGRHGLTREQVRESQRGRLLLALAETVAEQGYVRTAVADVLRRSHVSRSTFYEHFQDKETCFLALLDFCADLVADSLAEAVGVAGPQATPLQRFDAAMRRYLETLAAEWPVAVTFFLEAHAAGPAARERLFAVQDRFAVILAANFAADPCWSALPDPAFAGQTLSAALHALVASALTTGDRERLLGLRTGITGLLTHLLTS